MGKAIDDEVLLALAKKGGGGGGTDDYESLSHKPQVNGHTLEGNKTTSDLGIKFADLPDAPTIPNDLADLQDDSIHRLVTDTEKATWNGKSDFSGSYNDLTDKPTIPSQLTAGDYIDLTNNKINVKLQKGDYTEYEYRFTAAYSPVNQLTIEKYRDGVLVSTESYRNDASYTPIAIDGLFEIWYSAGNPRYYWCYKLLEDSQEHSAGYEDSWYYTDTATRTETFDVDDEGAELVTKGDLGTASVKDVPASGDASSSQVVMGNDSRLTDSRPASDVSAWAKQSTKPTYTASEVGAIATTQKGVASGVAELDANGKVPSSQLPSYVDDVVEGYYDAVTDRFYTESTFENVIPPESGKSWVDVASNKSYRWTGSVYSRVDEGVQLGETSGSAYRGDRGKTAYDHSQTTGNPHGTTASDVGLGNVPNVSTNDQEPTFTEASTRNNIASGEKLSVILGKIQKFFNDLKTVAFSGSYTDLSNKPSLATVATSGSYVDLSNKPTIPAAQVNADWNASSGVSAILNKPTIPTTASDLSYDNTDSGLTATDVQGAVDEVVASMGNMKMTKLWENANTSVSFAAQSITLSSDDYDMLLVLAKFSSASLKSVPATIGLDGYINFADDSNGIYRGYTVSGTTVNFTNANVGNTPDNTKLIPHQIYGIKLT